MWCVCRAWSASRLCHLGQTSSTPPTSTPTCTAPSPCSVRVTLGSKGNPSHCRYSGDGGFQAPSPSLFIASSKLQSTAWLQAAEICMNCALVWSACQTHHRVVVVRVCLAFCLGSACSSLPTFSRPNLSLRGGSADPHRQGRRGHRMLVRTSRSPDGCIAERCFRASREYGSIEHSRMHGA